MFYCLFLASRARFRLDPPLRLRGVEADNLPGVAQAMASPFMVTWIVLGTRKVSPPALAGWEALCPTETTALISPVSPSIPKRHPSRSLWVLPTRHQTTAHPTSTGVTLDPSYIFPLHQSSTTSSELLEINAEWVATMTTAPF